MYENNKFNYKTIKDCKTIPPKVQPQRNKNHIEAENR